MESKSKSETYLIPHSTQSDENHKWISFTIIIISLLCVFFLFYFLCDCCDFWSIEYDSRLFFNAPLNIFFFVVVWKECVVFQLQPFWVHVFNCVLICVCCVVPVFSLNSIRALGAGYLHNYFFNAFSF